MEDMRYFMHRAEQEARLAQQATNPAAVSAHYRLSTAYLERAQSCATHGTEDAG